MIRGLLKDSVVYGVSKYFGAFAAIFLTPIYTRLLTKADYGVMDLFATWNGFISMVLPLGLITSILRFYPDIKDNIKAKKDHLGTIMSSLLVLSIFYCLLMLMLKSFFSFELAQIDSGEEIYYHGIYIVIAGIFMSYFLTLFQTKFEKYKYLAVSLINLVLLTLFGFVFVYYYNMGVNGFFRASSLAISISLIFSLLLLRKELVISYDKVVLKKLLSYSIHILSTVFLFKATNLLDRYLLLEFDSMEGVGLYSIGVKISSIVALGVSSFAIAWFPMAMKIKDDDNVKSVYKKVHDLYFHIAFACLTLVILFRKELIQIFAPSYHDSFEIIAILSLFTIVNGSIYFYTLGLHIKNKTKYLTFSAIIAIVINAVSSIILLSFVGIQGVAWGTLIGSLVWVLMQLIKSQRLFKVDYNWVLSFSVLALSVGLMYFTPVLDNYIDVVHWRVLCKLLVVFLIAIFIFLRYKSFFLKKIKP